MNTPKSRKPKRYGINPAQTELAPDGTYSDGLWNDVALKHVGQITTFWTVVEEAMIDILAKLISHGNTVPARQIFRSIINQKSRIDVMRSILEISEINRYKPEIYDNILDEFARINKLRNMFVHSMYYTHMETGDVYILTNSIAEHPILHTRKVEIKEFVDCLTQMGKLNTEIAKLTFQTQE